MENEVKNTNVLPVLTETEIDVLKRSGMRAFNGAAASEAEVDAEESLIDKAVAYERENGLVDERFDFTDDCNLLVWFASKYGFDVRMEQNYTIV